MKMNLLSVIVALVLPAMAQAQSSFEGLYQNEDGSKQVRLTEFNRSLTLNTTSYYSTGQQVNWFFEFIMPTNHQVKDGETINGRVRSVDAYYNCVFDEKAFIQKDAQGNVKIHYPLLTYHRETRSVRDGYQGGYYQRTVDWTGWGWVETGYHFPIERWRVISSECVIDQRNWTTNILVPVNGGPQPLPALKK